MNIYCWKFTWEYGVIVENWVCSSKSWMSSGLRLAPSATSAINLQQNMKHIFFVYVPLFV
jgi:hypothetical protein